MAKRLRDLSEDQKRAIVRDYCYSTLTLPELAAKYGVSNVRRLPELCRRLGYTPRRRGRVAKPKD